MLQAGGHALQMEVWKCLQLKYLNASLRKTIVAAKPKVHNSSHGKQLLPYSAASGDCLTHHLCWHPTGR